MITIKCKCQKSSKNFKIDIGPFFINKCCLDAGFDKLGNKKDQSLEIHVPSVEETIQESSEAQEDLSQAVEISNEQAQELKEQPDLKKMKFVALQELCKQRGIEVTKDDRSKKSLIEKLQK